MSERQVYFARCGDYIKVGSSATPSRRLGAIKKLKAPDDLPPDERPTLYATMPGDYRREFDCQVWMWEWRAAGEWFHATPESLDKIDEILDWFGGKYAPAPPLPMPTPAEYGAQLAAARPPLTAEQVEEAARALVSVEAVADVA